MAETKKLTGKERRELAVEKQAEAMMSDQKYARLRTPAARVALVVTMAAIIVATPLAWVFGGSLIGLGFVLLSFLVWGALRVSVRVIADLPDTVLDERQVALRNAVYLDAYRWFAGLVLLAATAGLITMVILSNDFRFFSRLSRFEHCICLGLDGSPEILFFFLFRPQVFDRKLKR